MTMDVKQSLVMLFRVSKDPSEFLEIAKRIFPNLIIVINQLTPLCCATGKKDKVPAENMLISMNKYEIRVQLRFR